MQRRREIRQRRREILAEKRNWFVLFGHSSHDGFSFCETVLNIRKENFYDNNYLT